MEGIKFKSRKELNDMDRTDLEGYLDRLYEYKRIVQAILTLKNCAKHK